MSSRIGFEKTTKYGRKGSSGVRLATGAGEIQFLSTISLCHWGLNQSRSPIKPRVIEQVPEVRPVHENVLFWWTSYLKEARIGDCRVIVSLEFDGQGASTPS